MKTSRNITLFVSILAVGIFAALILRAQEMAMPIQDGTISLTDTNVDWNSMSDLEVELKAIESVPAIPAANAPQVGTFWSAQHAPGSREAWPPLPGNINSVPVWDLGDGVFLLSDLDFDYNPPVKFSLKGRSGMMMDAMDSSGVGGDGSDSGDGGVSPFNAPNYGTNLWLSIAGVSNSFANLFLENTEPEIQYEIQSKQDLTQTGWVSEGFVLGSELTNWTPMNVAQNGRTNLFFRIRSWADDGSGLPIWWQQQYFGTTGINPNALDSAGDGWTIYQKYQMGLNPNVFYTPPAPQGLTAIYNTSSSTATLNWLPAPGNVTGYTIERDDDSGATDFTASTDDFLDDVSGESPDPWNADSLDVSYKIQAHYAGGNSAWSPLVPLQQSTLSAYIFSGGSQGGTYLAVSGLPANAVTVRILMIDFGALELGDTLANTNLDIPVSAFTNGICSLPAYWSPPDNGIHEYVLYSQTIDANGNVSAANGFNNIDLALPYYDGRVQLKQNLIFLLRAGLVDYSFPIMPGLYDSDFDYGQLSYPTNYVYSSLYEVFLNSSDYLGNRVIVFDSLAPFEANYLFRNFVFDSSNLQSNGHINTGVYASDEYFYLSDASYWFDPTLTNSPPIAAVLATNDTRWLVSYPLDSDDSFLDEIGITSPNYTLASNAKNIYGLPFLSATIAYGTGGSPATTTLDAGGTTTQGGYFYPETAQPQFQTVEYDFWLPYDQLPGYALFSPTNKSRLWIAPVGSTISIAGYAKLAIQNGYTNKFAYLGQYFDAAYNENTNGVATTNLAGFVTPYGNFFPTNPGVAALVTMPDPDTGARGTCTVYCVSLALDRNHDGNMDTSFNGADATSASSPYTHWCNNNYDRYVNDADDNTYYDDDVKVQGSPGTSNQNTPDCNYLDGAGHRVIPCERDLQDFARLWVCGVTSNLLAALPAGSTVTLNWGDVGSPNSANPTIDLFQAADSDGGIGYLTNSTIADSQIDSLTSAYVGRLAPGGSIQLNAGFFSGWAGNHFIWCGVTNGSGQLNLTIADASGNVLVQASQWIQIVDIKQMYERYTVGDDPSQTPQLVATNATDGLLPFASAFQYTPPPDTNAPYILFVHGWNMEPWEKDRFAESAFKRLYWQGYHGRFGEFRWPTPYHVPTGNTVIDDAAQAAIYDPGEYQAWQSAQGLMNKLNDLNAEYPGHVYMLAHSMGNVVAGEALRLAAQDGEGQLVNTYVASQAAVPGHCYDSALSGSDLLGFVGGTLGPTTANIYNNWLATNSAAAGTRINFYNTNDYALSSIHWQLDEELKPDSIIGIHPPYGYSGSPSDNPPLQNGFYGTYPAYIGFDLTLYLGNTTSVSNRYEITAFAAEPRSTALGATPGIINFVNLDLTTVWPTDTSGHSYGDHFWHSAEFRGDCWQEWNYWQTLLRSSTLGFNINN